MLVAYPNLERAVCVAEYCSMLQHVAACCSGQNDVLVTCLAKESGSRNVCCRMLKLVAACCSMLQHVAVYCCGENRVLVAKNCSVCCSMLQHVAECVGGAYSTLI